jgi:tetratricopeptide (TPR) repeat protein
VVYGNYSRLLDTGWRDNPGRHAEARTYGEKSVALARGLAQADPRDMTAQYDLGVALSRSREWCSRPRRDLSESLATLREAIAIIEPIANGNPKSASIAVQLAVAQEFAGRRLQSMGQTSAAAEQYRKSLATVGPCAAVQSGFAYCALQTFTDEEALALLDADAGDHSAARALANRALARAQAFADGDPEIGAAHRSSRQSLLRAGIGFAGGGRLEAGPRGGRAGSDPLAYGERCERAGPPSAGEGGG